MVKIPADRPVVENIFTQHFQYRFNTSTWITTRYFSISQ